MRLSTPVLAAPAAPPQHLVTWGGFAGADFELSGGLLDEHFYAGDDLGSALAGHAQQAGFTGVVDHVEDVAGVDLVFLQRRFFRLPMPTGVALMITSKASFFRVGALDQAGAGTVAPSSTTSTSV